MLHPGASTHCAHTQLLPACTRPLIVSSLAAKVRVLHAQQAIDQEQPLDVTGVGGERQNVVAEVEHAAAAVAAAAAAVSLLRNGDQLAVRIQHVDEEQGLAAPG
jgi:hypothetical protein